MSLDLSSDKTYWTGYGLAPIPDPRDDEVLSTVRPLVEGDPTLSPRTPMVTDVGVAVGSQSAQGPTRVFTVPAPP